MIGGSTCFASSSFSLFNHFTLVCLLFVCFSSYRRHWYVESCCVRFKDMLASRFIITTLTKTKTKKNFFFFLENNTEQNIYLSHHKSGGNLNMQKLTHVSYDRVLWKSVSFTLCDVTQSTDQFQVFKQHPPARCWDHLQTWSFIIYQWAKVEREAVNRGLKRKASPWNMKSLIRFYDSRYL